MKIVIGTRIKHNDSTGERPCVLFLCNTNETLNHAFNKWIESVWQLFKLCYLSKPNWIRKWNRAAIMNQVRCKWHFARIQLIFHGFQVICKVWAMSLICSSKLPISTERKTLTTRKQKEKENNRIKLFRSALLICQQKRISIIKKSCQQITGCSLFKMIGMFIEYGECTR